MKSNHFCCWQNTAEAAAMPFSYWKIPAQPGSAPFCCWKKPPQPASTAFIHWKKPAQSAAAAFCCWKKPAQPARAANFCWKNPAQLGSMGFCCWKKTPFRGPRHSVPLPGAPISKSAHGNDDTPGYDRADPQLSGLESIAKRVRICEDSRMESEALPPLTPAEKAVVDALVAEGLAIQPKFRPEPLYRQSGKGHYEGNSVDEIGRVRESGEKDSR